MPSSLKKLGSKIFIYLIAFVLLFSLFFLFMLGLHTRKLTTNISDSFKDFSAEVNEVSEAMMSENVDSFIENYVDIESNSFSYLISDLRIDLSHLSDNFTLRYKDYDANKKFYDANIAVHDSYEIAESDEKEKIGTKVFYEKGIDRKNPEVIKNLAVLYDVEDDLILTITDTLQMKNCYISTEAGVSLFATSYNFNNSPKYSGDILEYKKEEWYTSAIATSSILFDGVYKDALSGKELIAVRKSILVDNVPKGVIVIEIYVDSLKENSIGLEPPQGANLFVVDEFDNIIYNARSDRYSDTIAKEGTLFEFLEESKHNFKGKGIYTYNGNEYRCFYKKVPDIGITLYVSIRENKVREDINILQRLVSEKYNLLHDIISDTSRGMFISILVFVAILVVILLFVAKKISKSLATPINELSDILEQASKIQQDMLPDDFEKLYKRKDIEIYAKNIPEAEVGGDFYNYIIRDNKLYLVIADVSGSGMPAAMFMAKTNTLLNSAIKLSESPRVILSYVNAELCKNNNECYFATIALYCVDLKTRNIEYANSGHEDSIIIKKDNEVILKKEVRSAPMGLDKFNSFQENEFTLDVGDILFLYTDGVVEAMNKKGELFGLDRLVDELKNIGTKNTKDIVLGIEKKVNEFAIGLEQYDDITMLCFKFKEIETDENKVYKCEKEYKAIYDSVDEVNEFIKESLKTSYENESAYKKYLDELNLCIEEIVVNICDYAFETKNDENNKFTVKISIDKNTDKLSISFIDAGKEFDPTQMRSVNILQGVDKRGIGGFGIHITKNIVDILEYERIDDKNILTMTKYL